MALFNRLKICIPKQLSLCRNRSYDNKIDTYKEQETWCERYEVKKTILKSKTDVKEYGNILDKLRKNLQTMHRIFVYKGEFTKYLMKKAYEEEILSQKFLQSRIDILGPDLAAAHFIISRGGLVKFLGHKQWIGRNHYSIPIPTVKMPGYYIECINASGTKLYYEGLQCLCNLSKLKWLSLKDLVNLNDFALDLVCGQYFSCLEYLDLTGCTGITHCGLTCMYKFKCLKHLNVTGMNHTPQFKMSCLMLQDIFPDLEIIGINYNAELEEFEKENQVTLIDNISYEKPNVLLK